ncbi:MAG: type II toxin-antitoxin system mRNA interferase toxin, RelE/StbE family [Candidatus Pacebacteria bacterium]|nr:type II toxin-antitoxin system mRNA interferase toxin, RelE/StbE family [Candidatus Paceibacterota bacterium]
MEIYYLPRFARGYKKLPEEVQTKAEVAERLFRADPFDPRLKTHKLFGHLAGFWSFSVSFSHRIIFEFVDEHTVRFYRIGDHDIYE